MNLRQITENIYYAGVNDRVIHRFESLWPVPDGISYNSYIVKGKKTALIDTVELGEAYALFAHLDSILDSAPLDYLVVNHMEPDHSGSIPLLTARYPSLKIVADKIAIGMIGDFYGITDPEKFIEVKDGDTLSLDGITLRFVMTPMVHWPETMMTFAEEPRVLFAGDAFGCYGALDGGITDEETDPERYLEEAYRYYANIVGKYGRFVQRAMAKAIPLNPDYICSTHGPVWHRRISDIVRIYDRLSRYQGEPGTVIVYGSMYGNTQALAEAIAIRLAERGEKNIRIFNAAKDHLSWILAATFRYDGLIVGAPTYSMTLFPPVDSFMKAIRTRELTGRTAGIFGSFTWASAALKTLEDYFTDMNISPAAKLDMKRAMRCNEEAVAFADSYYNALLASRSTNPLSNVRYNAR